MIPTAAKALRAGKLVIVPTETVYGLAADARSETAISELVRAKGRPDGKPFPVQVPKDFPIETLCTVSDTARALIARHWPGPLTLVLPCHAELPHPVTAGLGTLGLRCPDHAWMLALLDAFGGPLAVPSANRSGEPPAATVEAAQLALGTSAAVSVDGGRCDGQPSTVVSLAGAVPIILRQGALQLELS